MLNFLFDHFLIFNPILSITIFATIIIIIINIFYKILINQNEAKQIKDNIKEMNKKMKEEQKAGNKEKVNQLMKEIMTENSKIMRMTMKPMLISFIIVIIFLPWLATVYGDKIIAADSNMSLSIGDKTYPIEKYENKIKISELSIDCNMPCVQKIENYYWKIYQENENIKFARISARLPIVLPIFGAYLGWLGWYILVSIPIMMIIRKLMKIYV
ncbi:MAG: EMC3/TMCO1 family protein [Candidatus Aenigmatarchaeota archaeon]